MVTAELGCASGGLTLAMAQRGARTLGLDISDISLDVGRRYHDSIKGEVSGLVEYRATDLNRLDLPASTFDLIAVKGSLHHLTRVEHTIAEAHRALKPGGLLWVSDTLGRESVRTVIVAGALTLVLPTHTTYRDKLSGLRRFGLRSPSRVRASIQAEGLTPFEGAGRECDWLELIGRRFTIDRMVRAPAVTGYLAHQVNLPDRVARPLLRVMGAVDRLCVWTRLLHSTGLVVYARKDPSP